MPSSIVRSLTLLLLVAALAVAGCSQFTGAAAPEPTPKPTRAPKATSAPKAAKSAATGTPAPNAAATSVAPTVRSSSAATAQPVPTMAAAAGGARLPTATPSPEPTDAGTDVSPAGDIPDNAVFLTHTSAAGHYSIQYVEGWQHQDLPDSGVEFRDKDSSEQVTLVPLPPGGDIQGYVVTVDEPALKTSAASYQRLSVDTVGVRGTQVPHLRYTTLAPPNPVTGKRVLLDVDRYYVAGPARLAILTLSTPHGVDNVDAFRQMLESFAWR